MIHARVSTLILAAALTAACMTPAQADDTPSVTFSKDIAPIFHEKCGTCHRPGGVAPMSLLDYKSSRPWAKSIRARVVARTMPPWHAAPSARPFKNDISLTDDEIDLIVSWVAGGSPQGDPALLPDVPDYEALARTGLPEPDLTLEYDGVWEVEPGVDEQRAFVIENTFEHDLWVKGVDYEQNSPAVHHMFLFTDPSGLGRQYQQEDERPGFLASVDGGAGTDKMMKIFFRGGGGIGGWAPGAQPLLYGEDIGQRIPPGTDFLVQYHYFNQSGETQIHTPKIGLYLHDSPPPRKLEYGGPSGDTPDLLIPANDDNVETVRDWVAPEEIEILALMPHMHNLGKDMKLVAHYEDGTEETLLDVPRFDPYWQTVYEFEERVRIPKGTRLQMIAHHDNSAKNPLQLNFPPKDVGFGERADDEMVSCITIYAKTEPEKHWDNADGAGAVITDPGELAESRRETPND